jgi:signal transduction histidine kinase
MTHDPDKVSILVVDDEPGDADLYARLLEGAGYRVETAETLRQARAKIADRSYAVLLVDLRLPDGDGLELLEPARANDPHTVAVVITAFTSIESAVAAIKAGAYDFLTKPVPSEKFVSAMHRAAERYHLAAALSERTQQLESVNEQLDQRVKDATGEIFELNERLRRYVGQLVETNNHQTRYLEDMAHELKNPLAVVMGYASYLTRAPIGTFDQEEVEKCMSAVLDNAQQLHNLIEELLDSTRLASRKIAIAPQELSGAEALSQAVDGMKFKAEERGISLSVDLPERADLTVAADPIRLKQILNNLITNAIKFTPSGGKIVARARASKKAVQFSISDNGRGMSADQVERIFDRFFQVPGSNTDTNRGLGLGLNIVHGLVKLHGGRIWAESEEGRGSTFYFTLPTSVDHVPTAAEDAGDLPVPGLN